MAFTELKTLDYTSDITSVMVLEFKDSGIL